MAVRPVILQTMWGAPIVLPEIKYIGSPPALPITIETGTEEAEMSDKSRRLAFFNGPNDAVWRDFSLGWGYLSKTELDVIIGFVSQKATLQYKNPYEDAARWYVVYVASFSYEFVRSGLRDLGGADVKRGRYKAVMTLREV